MGKELVPDEVLVEAAQLFDRWLSEICLEAARPECARVDKLRRSIHSAERLPNANPERVQNLHRALEVALADVSDRCRKESLRVPTTAIACPDGDHTHRVVQVGVG